MKKKSTDTWYEKVRSSHNVRKYNFPQLVINELANVARQTHEYIYAVNEDLRDETWEYFQQHGVSDYVKYAAKLVDRDITNSAGQYRFEVVGKFYNQLTGRVELAYKDESGDTRYVPLEKENPVSSQEDQDRLLNIVKKACQEAMETDYGDIVKKPIG